MSELSPEFLADMRGEGSDHLHRVLQSLMIHAAFRAGKGKQIIGKLHKAGNNRVQAEIAESLGDRGHHLVVAADHLPGRFEVLLILIVHDQVVEP